jgi:hypothetical protein
MRTLKNLIATACTVLTVVVFSTSTPARAQEPHYLQALGELRTAKEYIMYDTKSFNEERRELVGDINKAMDEIKHAAWDDGKQTQFAPPGHGGASWAPMHLAGNALYAARKHVEQGVDIPQNAGLRERAIHHIAEAERRIKHVMDEGAE